MSDKEQNSGGAMSGLVEFLRSWGPAIAAVLVIRTFVFEPFRIPSGSMVPTMQVGDQVIVNKASYGLWAPSTLLEIPFLEQLLFAPSRFELFDLGDPERGDIVVFRYPNDPHVNYIKRVVAIPGDKIRVQDNQIFLNGVAQKRVYKSKYTFVDQRCSERETKLYMETVGETDHYKLVLPNPGPLADMAEREVPEGHVFVMGDNRDNSEDSRRWGFVRYDQIKGKAHFIWLSFDSCKGGLSPRMERIGLNLYDMDMPVE